MNYFDPYLYQSFAEFDNFFSQHGMLSATSLMVSFHNSPHQGMNLIISPVGRGRGEGVIRLHSDPPNGMAGY